MSSVRFSNQLFGQIGGVNWQKKAGFSLLNTSEPTLEQTKQVHSCSSEKKISPPYESSGVLPHIVVLGVNLDTIWQDETHLAWQLWQNIMLAFNWDESQIVFFDTQHLVEEEGMLSTIEEVIELGVDWVLCMDDEHPIVDLLQEGVQTVSVPDLELMLFDPYAKQTFYRTLTPLLSVI